MSRFPQGFFDRQDETPDAVFYEFDRFVTHIDDGAIAAVGALYAELELTGDVLDLCSSWISHFESPPRRLVAMGMNANELAANPMVDEWHVRDLNLDPSLPFGNGSFDAVTCCVSVDYLTRPVEVFREAARVLRPGGWFVTTFSNRCFPTKAIRGWLSVDDRGRCMIVGAYFQEAGGFETPRIELRNPDWPGDPLYAVYARRLEDGATASTATVRDATRDDQAFITRMQYEALFVPPGTRPFDRSVLDEPGISRYHAGFGTRPGDVGVVALDEAAAPIGAAWARLVPDGYGAVDDHTPELGIAVVPEHRGRGVGGALLEALLERVPRCSLSVDDRNPARRLYERFGFRPYRSDGHSLTMLREAR